MDFEKIPTKRRLWLRSVHIRTDARSEPPLLEGEGVTHHIVRPRSQQWSNSVSPPPGNVPQVHPAGILHAGALTPPPKPVPPPDHAVPATASPSRRHQSPAQATAGRIRPDRVIDTFKQQHPGPEPRGRGGPFEADRHQQQHHPPSPPNGSHSVNFDEPGWLDLGRPFAVRQQPANAPGWTSVAG